MRDPHLLRDPDADALVALAQCRDRMPQSYDAQLRRERRATQSIAARATTSSGKPGHYRGNVDATPGPGAGSEN
ncbi:hypothetical protein [Paraburkholderia sp.]|uniref:hypothetical protein n=1 Tax=Paraburkholderia sp. TaxID=1926495 RepID=UPI002F41BECC